MPVARDEQREIRQAPPLVAFALAAFLAVMIFLPPEGRIGVPLHDGLVLLLGRATFMLPWRWSSQVCCSSFARCDRPRRSPGAGWLVSVCWRWPSCRVNTCSANADDGTGLIGQWLSTWLLDLLGGPGTLVLLVAVLGLGALLAFDVKLFRAGGPWRDAES